MNKTIKNFVRKYWLVLCLLIASLSIITATIVYAAYNKTSTAKSVVARVGAVGKNFSSNYLQRGTAMMDVPLYVNESDTEPGDYIRISNFPQGNPGDPYYRKIDYTLTLRMVYNNGSDYVLAPAEVVGDRFIKATFNGTTYTFNNSLNTQTITSSLAGNTPSTDSIKLVYSSDQVTELTDDAPTPTPEKLYLEVIAEPTPRSSYLDLEILQGRINLQLNSNVEPVTWRGYFNDAGAKNAPVGTVVSSSLEGFNYVIEGVGEGTITLSWNTTYLELNNYYITSIVAAGGTYTPPTGGADPALATLVFSVNSNTTSRYDTQFYLTGEDASHYATWGAVKGYVSCVFS